MRDDFLSELSKGGNVRIVGDEQHINIPYSETDIESLYFTTQDVRPTVVKMSVLNEVMSRLHQKWFTMIQNGEFYSKDVVNVTAAYLLTQPIC